MRNESGLDKEMIEEGEFFVSFSCDESKQKLSRVSTRAKLQFIQPQKQCD